MRRKKTLRVASAKTANGQPIPVLQEEWEGGFTLLLPAPRKQGERFLLAVTDEGDFLFSDFLRGCDYPYLTNQWYPRHGFLQPSTYELSFRHRNRGQVAAQGLPAGTRPAKDNGDDKITGWRMTTPIQMATFGWRRNTT